MPTAAIIAAGIGAVGAIGGAAVAAHGNSQASKTQAGTAAQALDFSKAQEAERKREWDTQQTAAAAQWKAKQDMLRPFNAAAYSVLGKYGIPVSMSDPTPPQAQAMPADWQPGMPLPGSSPSSGVPSPSPTSAMPPVPPPAAVSGVPPPVGSPMAPATGGVQPPSTMGQMMGTHGAFDWQSPFAKPGGANA